MKLSVKKIFLVIALAALLPLLFVKVTTRQTINYKLRTYRIPLYIKTIEFIDRDYRYRMIVRDITAGSSSGKEKVVSIFDWCKSHIRHQPDGLDIVDDHPLNIIIRGYGVDDQLEDVFTLLCTYAGFESFYKIFYARNNGAYFISFIKIDGQWYPFSVYGGAYPNKGGRPASVEEIAKNPSLLGAFSSRLQNFDRDAFLNDLKTTQFKAISMRVKGQSPFGRLFYYSRSCFK